MIRLENISKTYMLGKSEVQALRNISLRIEQGEFVAVMGPSGSGKSTLMHVVGLLDRPDSGSYRLWDREVTDLSGDMLATARNKLAGFVFQQFHLLPRATALENAELPLVYAGRRGGRDIAGRYIEEVGLGGRFDHRPNELSGGEQQRVAIARALVNDPALVLADEPTGNLDTESGNEIIDLLKQLNEKGKTIIAVTHEPEIARRFDRIIHMRDGRIVSDEKTRQGPKVRAHSEPEAAPAFTSHASALGRAQLMDHFRQALTGMGAHKLRSFLSMLGILIGVGAVITMLALGRGAEKSITERLATLGSNVLSIHPGASRRHGVSYAPGEITRFTVEDVAAIRRLPEVSRASGRVNGRGQVVYGNRNWNCYIQGVESDYAEMRSYVPEIGRFFTDAEVKKREKVAVLGTTVVEELFGNANPVGASVRINRVKFRVIGILPHKGMSHWRDMDDVVFVPLTTAMYRLFGRDYVGSIDVEVRSSGLMERAQESISSLIKQRRKVDADKETFRIRNREEIREMLTGTTKTMAWLLGSIAGISLLVGGIGIMNIMLVSVTERTREIGLRKAIGARNRDITAQFLMESVVMTFIGGVAGVLFGIGAAQLLAVLANWTVSHSPAAILLASGFSACVGLVFGLWPAHHASRLNPIDALRYE
ncbi:MAG: ABC transporter permease [Kiritimatiellia bacterium]